MQLVLHVAIAMLFSACKPDRLPTPPPPPPALWEVTNLNVSCVGGPASITDVWVRPNGSVVAIESRSRVIVYSQGVWECVYQRQMGLTAVWASDSQIVAVGDSTTSETTTWGLIVTFDGTEWSDSLVGHQSSWRVLQCVWGRSESEVYAGGFFGTRYRFDGSSWTDITQRASSVETAIHGNRDLIVMVGEYNDQISSRECMLSVLEGPGEVFKDESCPAGSRIEDVVVLPNSRVVAIASEQILERDSNGNWHVVPIPLSVTQLSSVWGIDDDHIFAAGSDAILLRYEAEQWREMQNPVTWSVRLLAGASLGTLVAFGDSRTEFMRYAESE